VDAEVYLVLDDFGTIGKVYLETDPNTADEKTIIANMLSGQYNCPERVVVFITAEGWARDVSDQVYEKMFGASARIKPDTCLETGWPHPFLSEIRCICTFADTGTWLGRSR
jgi:hypothetical protein